MKPVKKTGLAELLTGLRKILETRGPRIPSLQAVADPRYPTAFSSTRSEIIIPVLDVSGELVIGTIDIESESLNAFNADTQSILEAAAEILRPLWHSVNRAN